MQCSVFNFVCNSAWHDISLLDVTLNLIFPICSHEYYNALVLNAECGPIISETGIIESSMIESASKLYIYFEFVFGRKVSFFFIS